MELDKSWKQKAIDHVKESWGTYPNEEWDMSEGYNCYLAGVADFKQRAIEELDKYTFDDTKYEDVKEGMLGAIKLLKNLKV